MSIAWRRTPETLNHCFQSPKNYSWLLESAIWKKTGQHITKQTNSLFWMMNVKNYLAFWTDEGNIDAVVKPDADVFAGSVVEPDDRVRRLRVLGRQRDDDVLIQVLQKADPFWLNTIDWNKLGRFLHIGDNSNCRYHKKPSCHFSFAHEFLAFLKYLRWFQKKS